MRIIPTEGFRGTIFLGISRRKILRAISRFGNPELSFINSLATHCGYADHHYGVTHESLANYVTAVTGNNWGTNGDNPTQRSDHANLADQLTAHRLTWKGYMESMPSAGFEGTWYPDNLPAGRQAEPDAARCTLRHQTQPVPAL